MDKDEVNVTEQRGIKVQHICMDECEVRKQVLHPLLPAFMAAGNEAPHSSCFRQIRRRICRGGNRNDVIVRGKMEKQPPIRADLHQLALSIPPPQHSGDGSCPCSQPSLG